MWSRGDKLPKSGPLILSQSHVCVSVCMRVCIYAYIFLQLYSTAAQSAENGDNRYQEKINKTFVSLSP